MYNPYADDNPYPICKGNYLNICCTDFAADRFPHDWSSFLWHLTFMIPGPPSLNCRPSEQGCTEMYDIVCDAI